MGECEAEADGLLQAAQKTIGKISALAPDAIASLKSAVLNLFGGGDDGSQLVNPTPVPQPLPGGSASSEQLFTPTPADTSREQHAIGQDVVCQVQQHAVGQDVVLSEQLFAPAENVAETLISADAPELAGQHSPLACQLTDARLTGQSYHLTCDSYVLDKAPQVVAETAISASVSINKLGDNAEADSLFKLVEVTPSLAYMKRNDDGQIFATYIGFNNKSKAKQWSEWLSLTHSVATKAEVRVAKRLTGFKYEVKASGVSVLLPLG